MAEISGENGKSLLVLEAGSAVFGLQWREIMLAAAQSRKEERVMPTELDPDLPPLHLKVLPQAPPSMRSGPSLVVPPASLARGLVTTSSQPFIKQTVSLAFYENKMSG